MYNKNRCIENIYRKAKEKGIKIGELEEAAGMSKGYLSRVNKPEYIGSPPIEMLDFIANQLGVGIDYLVNYSTEDLTTDEQFLMQFIDRLSRLTLRDKLEWIPETKSILAANDHQEVENPMVTVSTIYSKDNEEKYVGHIYRSGFYDGDTSVANSCYHADLGESGTVFVNAVSYLIPVDERYYTYREEKGVIEMYLVHSGTQPLCSSYYVSEATGKAIRNLYRLIESIPSRIALSDSTKSALQRFMDLEDK